MLKALTLQAIDEDGLMENCRVVGNHFLEGYNYLRDKYDNVGDVRGKGLMMAMEFVETKDTMNPLPMYKMNAMLERIKVRFRECTTGRLLPRKACSQFCLSGSKNLISLSCDAL